MLARLLLLFTVVPLVELVLLLVLADYTSWRFAVGMVLVTGVVGAILARYEGMRAWRRAREAIEAGRLPTDPMLDAVMILVAGAFLVTPGVLTDLAGFGLLLPPVRRVLKNRITRRLGVGAGFVASAMDDDQPHHSTGNGPTRVIDVRVEPSDESPEDDDPS